MAAKAAKLRRSLVMAVHNEEELLPHILPTLTRLPIEEFVLVQDRCTDGTWEAWHRYLLESWRRLRWEPMSLVKNWNDYRHPRAEAFNYGMWYATGDILYVTAADIIHDPLQFSLEYWRDPEVGMVDFRYRNMTMDGVGLREAWEHVLIEIMDLTPRKGTLRSGLFGVRRSVFEEVGGLEDSPTEEDWLRKTIVRCGYKHRHITETRNIHLRAVETPEQQRRAGETRKMQGYPLWYTIGHSILHYHPDVLRGYLETQTPA